MEGPELTVLTRQCDIALLEFLFQNSQTICLAFKVHLKNMNCRQDTDTIFLQSIHS